MSETRISTDRRAFLKTGALAATPLVALAPVTALAGDDSRARLARLEDERAVEALQRKFLRHLNGTADCGESITSADAVDLGTGLRSITEDMGHEAELALSEDGLSATGRCACRIEREVEFTGDSTLERMARFEGLGSHRHAEQRVLATQFVKGTEGWRIASARLA